MSQMRTVVFPGTFDPLTNGHVDLIERGVRLFDRVVVAILINPAKQPLFPLDERLAMAREVFAGRGGIVIESYSGLLVDFVGRHGAVAVMRGLRGATDFDYERQMALMNRHLSGEVDTIFLVPSAATAHISATLVREIAAVGGSVSGLVPRAVDARFTRLRPSPTVRV
jgi:pantetheine-phosphate adenylyltransferase